jgi:hypothetical protein
MVPVTTNQKSLSDQHKMGLHQVIGLTKMMI